jgi:hypothetical protein
MPSPGTSERSASCGVCRDGPPDKAAGPQARFNPITGKRSHGINVLILGMDMRVFETGDPRWMLRIFLNVRLIRPPELRGRLTGHQSTQFNLRRQS